MLVLLHSDKKNPILFLNFGLFTFFIVCVDAFIELYFGANILGNFSIPGRLAGLFGDRWVMGSFLIRFLPILVGLFFINYQSISTNQRKLTILIFFLASTVVVFSGERTAYLLLFIYLTLIFSYLIKKINTSFILILFFFIVILISSPLLYNETSDRLLNNVLFYLTNFDYQENQYLSLYHTGFIMFLNNPLLGIGPNNFRLTCFDEIYYLSNFSCSTHPHNILIQLLSETGLAGTVIVYFIFFYFCKLIYIKIINSKFDYYEFGVFSIVSAIVMNLWPFLTSGNFFLSWNGYIYFLPIIFYLFYKSKKY